ncbi:MAG: trypsin-like peptidase domain-containing protein [Patescibacteria group bacterium]
MEELNKNQIVLLTLLISFVTSIATGIVTVTLLEQAPPTVTQTINRVVERTIEKTVPGDTKTTTVIKEVPVIVTEEQLIVDVINAASPAVVRIADKAGSTLGSGFIITDEGLLATADKIFATNNQATIANVPGAYQVFLSDKRTAMAQVVRSDAKRGITLLKLDLASLKDADGKNITNPKLTKLDLVETEALPGQTVVALGVPDNGPITVAGGIVSGLFSNTASSTVFINTSAANQNNLGGPIVNTKGKAVGVSTDVGLALTAKMVRETLNALPK